MSNLLPCPFCGMAPDLDDGDTLYPTGTVWREIEDGMRSYHHYQERQEGDAFCYGMNCPETRGGCGVRITADGKDEAIAAWNRRSPVQPTEPEHIAWARYVRVDDDPTRIVLCNSNVEGAFKVYRHPPPQPTEPVRHKDVVYAPSAEAETQAKWLEQVAAEIAKAGHNGWGNTCLQAAAFLRSLCLTK